MRCWSRTGFVSVRNYNPNYRLQSIIRWKLNTYNSEQWITWLALRWRTLLTAWNTANCRASETDTCRTHIAARSFICPGHVKARSVWRSTARVAHPKKRTLRRALGCAIIHALKVCVFALPLVRREVWFLHLLPIQSHSKRSTFTKSTLGPQIRRGYPPNLSISFSGGKETKEDSPSNGERTGISPAPNRASPDASECGVWERHFLASAWRPSPLERGPFP